MKVTTTLNNENNTEFHLLFSLNEKLKILMNFIYFNFTRDKCFIKLHREFESRKGYGFL